jgi:hypothetical protein
VLSGYRIQLCVIYWGTQQKHEKKIDNFGSSHMRRSKFSMGLFWIDLVRRQQEEHFENNRTILSAIYFI